MRSILRAYKINLQVFNRFLVATFISFGGNLNHFGSLDKNWSSCAMVAMTRR